MINYVPNFLFVVAGLNQLLTRVAERVCDCYPVGNRVIDPSAHVSDCEYRKPIENSK